MATEDQLYAEYMTECTRLKRLEEKLYLVSTRGPMNNWDAEKCRVTAMTVEGEIQVSRHLIITKQNAYIAKYAQEVEES